MTKRLTDPGKRQAGLWRPAGWGLAGLLLLLPLAAMQFTDEVNWTAGDFIFAAALIGGVGAAFELTVRISRNGAYLTAVCFALTAVFLIIWVNAAVGMIGPEDNPLNIMFFGVIMLALLGAALARFQPKGMSRAMTVATIAHLLASAIGLFTDMQGGILSAVFAALWLLSAHLFSKAAPDRERAG